MVIFYKKWKKYYEIQLTNNKMDLNIQKMTNHPPFPWQAYDYFRLGVYGIVMVTILL